LETKKYSARGSFPQEGADAVGAKGQIGRHPVRENAVVPRSYFPEVREDSCCEAVIFQGREGDVVRERLTAWARDGESLRGPKAQESNGPCLELILRGAMEWARLFLGEETAEVPVQGPEGFCRKAQERKRCSEKSL